MAAKATTGCRKREAVAESVAPLAPRLLDEEGAAAYLGLATKTLRDLRPATPLRFTEETIARAVEGEGIAPIPFLKIGRAVRYDVRMLDAWIGRQRVFGRLPDVEAPAGS